MQPLDTEEGSRHQDGVYAPSASVNNIVLDDNASTHNLDHDCNEEEEEEGKEEDNDDDDDDDELDAFLVALEKRCRSDFASCDLSHSIQQQQQQQQQHKQAPSSSYMTATSSTSHPSQIIASPSDFMRKLRKVFPRAEKNVKLNCLIGMLGLDDDATVSRRSGIIGLGGNNNDGRKIDTQIYQLLCEAEGKDDEIWVRVIAGIVRSIMFRRQEEKEGDKISTITAAAAATTIEMEKVNGDNTNGDDDDVADEKTKKRETEFEKQLHKIVTEILRHGLEESSPSNTHEDTNTGTGCGGRGVDVDPLFVPMYYALLSPATLCSILPEVGCSGVAASSVVSSSFATAHFSPNMDASILNVDALAEDSRSREEKKIREDQRKESVMVAEQQLQTNGFGEGVVGRISNGSGKGGGGPTLPIESALQRTSGLLVERGGGRGQFANMVGREGRGGRGIYNHGTSSSSSSSLFLRPASSAVGRGGLVAGRGRTDGRAGGRLSTSPGRSGSLSRLLGTARGGGRGRGAVAAVASTTGRGGGGGVKMLDASDVEGLARVRAELESHAAGLSSVEARKIERKRKLMEEAAASGLKKSR